MTPPTNSQIITETSKRVRIDVPEALSLVVAPNCSLPKDRILHHALGELEDKRVLLGTLTGLSSIDAARIDSLQDKIRQTQDIILKMQMAMRVSPDIREPRRKAQ